MNRFYPFIKKNFPDKIKDFEFAINNPKEHYKEIEREVKNLEKKYNLKVREIIKHNQ